MGSLKENLRGLREDHKLGEVLDEGHGAESSDCSNDTGRTQTGVSPVALNAGEYEPGPQPEGNSDKEGDKNPVSKEMSHSVCNDVDPSDSIEVSSGPIPVIQQPEADKIAVTNEDKAISIKLPGDAGADNQEEAFERKNAELENISIPVPFTPGPYDPRSPAPEGQHHMRTQVSLEVVQCHSAATSPMTPPEGGHSFFFPASLTRFSGSYTKDAEQQVGPQVEFCSVATSPMTPKTPFSCAFSEFVEREVAHKGERVEMSEEQRKSAQQETKSSAKSESEINVSKELSEDESDERPESADSCPAAGLTDTQESLKDKNGSFKQVSMDQDITITVTQYNVEEDAEEEELLELHVIKLEEYKHQEGVNDVKDVDGMGHIPHALDMSNTNHTGEVSAYEAAQSDVETDHLENSHQDQTDASVMRPSVPESPAPFGCHNIRTQVSLEVVQSQSVATSPMTPPEGDQAFCFPSSFGRCAAVGAETKDAELQVGRQVEFCSVATAPMTPRTPMATTFPDMKEGPSVGKIEEEMASKQEVLEGVKGEETGSEVKPAEDESKEVRNCKEKCEEPVQEVSWDEKGMTWEVYGAVVEVAVLGSAIQKHLEKQVMKKRQPSMPPPPPLNPSAKPISLESIQRQAGKGRAGNRRPRDGGEVSRRRRNPFRQMMENMQQPHCCSKAHTTE